MDKKVVFRKLAGAAIFILLLALVLLLLSYWFYPQQSEDITMQDVKPNGLLAEEDNTIDVILFGDSEAYTAFSPIQMWRDEGFPSFVCASSSQYISLTESFVHQALEHQKPKLVVLETYAFYRKMRSDNAFITRIENMFSIIQYHNRWKIISPIKMKSADYTWKDDMKGYKYAKMTTKGQNKQHMIPTDKIKPIPETNAKYVERIVEYCKQKGVQVLFISTPSTKNWTYEKHNAVVQLAEKTGVDYLDLNLQKEIKIDWHTDTADAGDHLNFRGAKKVNAFLGKYLAETYHLEDKRNDPAYAEWNALIPKFEFLTSEK
ncbi:MAG: hypothetical protein IJG23_00880 [Clostridia bacterium]|nr:hypothetical protein [Clostridia bacterium]